MQKHSKKLENILKYLVASMLLVVPLYPKFPFIKIPGTFVSIRLEDFIIVFAALVIGIIIISQRREFLKDNVNKAILIYLSVGFVSLVSALFVTKTISPHLGFLHWARRIEYFIPYFLGVYVLRNRKKEIGFYIKVLMVAIFLAFLYGLGQRYLNWPIIVTQNLEYSQGVALRYVPGSHINSTFAGHYDLGTYLVFLLPIFISLFFLTKNFRNKVVLLTVFLGGLWLLSNSGSRISAFSYLISATFSLVLIKKFKAIPLIFLISFIFFSMSPSLTARYSRIIEVTQEKLKGIDRLLYFPGGLEIFAQGEHSGLPVRRDYPPPAPTPPPVFEDRSTAIRLNVEWPRALRALSKNPLLGTGYSSITLATDNDYLRLLGEVGILGFIAFSAIFLRMGKLLLTNFPFYRNYKGFELGFMVGVVSGTSGVFINAFLLDIFEASKFAIVFWLIMGMAISLAKKSKYE